MNPNETESVILREEPIFLILSSYDDISSEGVNWNKMKRETFEAYYAVLQSSLQLQSRFDRARELAVTRRRALERRQNESG